ncbi:potassium/sodium hyperpolarization-activated cyclic nucleotide-gated channel 3 isoform X1 [Caretta caretta]|uniref:potassium/sodium hyperpolarization-activated cyclic nucleotide-gated channel 3 isoform X1 n=1 Tax=Caretta caretta TaxID=8467 RepID=UPI003F4B20E1
MVVHWNACIQFYTENLLQFPVNSWVYQQNLTMNDIQEYISYRKLPQDLCQRIFTYYDIRYPYYDIRYQGRWYNEEEILNEMSEPLKEEVKHHLCARLVKKVSLFQHCDLNFLNAVIMHLNIELFQPTENLKLCNRIKHNSHDKL